MYKIYEDTRNGMPWCEQCECYHHKTAPHIAQIQRRWKWKARAPGFLILAAILAACSMYQHLGQHDTPEATVTLCWAILMMVCYIAFKGER